MAVYFENNNGGFSSMKTEKFVKYIEECELLEEKFTPRE